MRTNRENYIFYAVFFLFFLYSFLLYQMDEASSDIFNNRDGQGSIRGKVINAQDKKPISKAEIEIKPLGLNTYSDHQGNFLISNIPVNDFSQEIDILVTKDGYGDFMVKNEKLLSGNILNVEARLSAGDETISYDASTPKIYTGQQSVTNLPEGQGDFGINYDYYSDFSPPPYIDVAIRSGDPPGNTSNPIIRVDRVDFKTYVKSVLSHEWIDSWNINSLKAGAMAVKNYGWYWVNTEPTKLSDVQSAGGDVDNTVNYQVYIPTWYTNSGKAVDETWAFNMTRSSKIFQSFYHAGTYDGSPTDGNHMHQWGSKYWADNGQDWSWILNFYYSGINISSPYSVHAPNIASGYAGWNTPLIIQNLDSSSASMTVYFFDSNGQNIYQVSNNSVKSGASWSVNPASIVSLPGSYQGSAIIYSNRPVSVIVNEHAKEFSMAYEGFPEGSTDVYLPNITRNYFGWTTPFIIQNVDSANAQVEVRFFNSEGNEVTGAKIDKTIKPNSSVGINPLSLTSLGSVFQGSAVVKSTNNMKIVASVNEHSGKATMSYSGLIQGGTKLFLPNIVKNYSGWTTPLVIQNIGNSQTGVDIQFYNIQGTEIVDASQTATINSGSSLGLNPANIKELGNVFKGSAVISSNSQDIVAICNEQSSEEAMAYSGISSGANINYLPNITRNYFGWTTPFIIQNVDSANAQVEVRFFNSEGNEVTGAKIDKTIKPNSSVGINPSSIIQLGVFKGSVKISSTAKIATVVNEHEEDGQAMSYNGF